MTGVELINIKMNIQEMIDCVLWRCDFCHDDCFPLCPHDVGYRMCILAMDMLETGDNPLI